MKNTPTIKAASSSGYSCNNFQYGSNGSGNKFIMESISSDISIGTSIMSATVTSEAGVVCSVAGDFLLVAESKGFILAEGSDVADERLKPLRGNPSFDFLCDHFVGLTFYLDGGANNTANGTRLNQ